MTKITAVSDEDPDDERPDPLNPDLYRVKRSDCPVEAAILAVPVRKPNRQEFVRVHPDPEYTRDVELLEFTGCGGEQGVRPRGAAGASDGIGRPTAVSAAHGYLAGQGAIPVAGPNHS